MGTTPKGYPYPEGTDLVVDGDDAIEALATAIDTKLPAALTSGLADLGNVTGQQTGSKVVTFPVGLFTVAPTAATTGNTSFPSSRGKANSYGSATTSSMTVYGFYDAGTTATAPLVVSWIAVQAAGAVVGLAARAARAPLGEPVPDAVVTCSTPGCPNNGYPIPVCSYVEDEDGTRHPPTAGFECGVCGADITDSLTLVDPGEA
jgi:hypothetical protein